MEDSTDLLTSRLPFPPVTRSHILHCSYHHWHPKYRSITPKARLIPLSAPFLSYLRSDGIILPPDSPSTDIDLSSTDTDSAIFFSTSSPNTSDPDDSDSDTSDPDPSTHWPEIHQKITSTIIELGGNVIPKLNWSAPKDATWINATNSMECRSANDVYLLLKSSDFVTHDLEQVFDGCYSESPLSPAASNSKDNEKKADDNNNDNNIPYHLILRKTIPALVPSLEFRCFIRHRSLLCICQRDLNHYDFLPGLVPTLRPLIERFFEQNLRMTFEDESFVFDVYIPPPHQRVWLMDVNPWAPRTDPLLFSWLEVLEMLEPVSPSAATTIPIDGNAGGVSRQDSHGGEAVLNEKNYDDNRSDDSASDDEDGEEAFTPEFRLVGRDDPEAYAFNTPRYSAHKMPKDVVDAGGCGEAGLREFMGRWREVVREQESQDAE